MDFLKLQIAAEAVIRAEYEFRAGGRAYQPDTQGMFENAMDELRRAATGKSELAEAATVLGKGTIKRKRLAV